MPNPKKFTPLALRDWQARMGYSERDAADELGCSRESLRKWKRPRSAVPRYIGLACAALALGMTSYGAAAPTPRGGFGK